MPQHNHAIGPEDVYRQAMPLIRSLHSIAWAAERGEGSEEHRLGLYSDVARAAQIVHRELVELMAGVVRGPALTALHRATAVTAALGLMASAVADPHLLLALAYPLPPDEYPGSMLMLIEAEWKLWRDTELPERWIAGAEEVAHG